MIKYLRDAADLAGRADQAGQQEEDPLNILAENSLPKVRPYISISNCFALILKKKTTVHT